MTRKLALVLVAAIGVAAGVAYLFPGEQPAPPAPPAAPSTATPAKAPAPPRQAAPAAAAIPPPEPAFPPPALAGPVPKEPPATLKARALAGDVQAACRFAFAINRCTYLKVTEKSILDQRRALVQQGEDSPGFEAKWAATEKLIRDAEPVQRMCEAIPPEDVRDGWRYLLQAAQAGHGPSVMRFISGFGLDHSSRPLDTLDQWLAYREQVPILLERALAAGHLEAYQFAAMAYERGPWGESPLPRDPVKALAYRLALIRSTAPENRVTLEASVRNWADQQKLDASQLSAAEALAATVAGRINATAAPMQTQDGGCDSASAATASPRSPPRPSP